MEFLWGVATSAYQIEGAVDADGRVPSIWDTFSHSPGRVALGETGDVACDHYHRWPADFELLAGLGVDAYRFSIAWPRLIGGQTRGLDVYRRQCERLRELGITPFITLYHWDLPQVLEDAGGWRSRDTAYRFAEYAGVVADALDEFAPGWITLNEPYCSAITSYAEGRHAPGAREGQGALAAAHHLMLGHGLAVAELRARGAGSVGITLNMSPAVAASSAPADLAAAQRQDLLVNRLFTEPILGGVYPPDAQAVWGDLTDFAFRRDGDLEVIAAPLDFLGVNYYYRVHVRDADAPREPDRTAYDIGVINATPSTVETTGLGWPIEPEGLHATLVRLRQRFDRLPTIYVTENGCSYPDVVDAGGRVRDEARIRFLDSHLAAIGRAIDDGVDVRGYFCWSLIDNFEWARGYAPRFGLVHVDYATQARTPKDSYHWYADRIRRGQPGTGSAVRTPL